MLTDDRKRHNVDTQVCFHLTTTSATTNAHNSLATAKCHSLRDHVLADPLFAALSAETRLFHSAKRHYWIGYDPSIYTYLQRPARVSKCLSRHHIQYNLPCQPPTLPQLDSNDECL